MKKLVLFFAAAIVAVSFAACGNAAKSTEETQDTTAVEAVVEEAVVLDTTAVETPAAEVETPAAE